MQVNWSLLKDVWTTVGLEIRVDPYSFFLFHISYHLKLQMRLISIIFP